MSRFRLPARPRRIAAGAMCAAAAICALTLVEAWRLEPLPSAHYAAEPVPVEGGAARVDTEAASLISAAVDMDPFHPSRTRPAARYRLPGDLIAPRAAVPTGPLRLPPVHLQGVAVLPNGRSLAALSVRGRPAELVRVGQLLEDWLLVRVESGRATLVGGDSTVVLVLPNAFAQARP